MKNRKSIHEIRKSSNDITRTFELHYLPPVELPEEPIGGELVPDDKPRYPSYVHKEVRDTLVRGFLPIFLSLLAAGGIVYLMWVKDIITYNVLKMGLSIITTITSAWIAVIIYYIDEQVYTEKYLEED